MLIAGPTASGKSALAMRVASALNGVVVNTDSMQVYSDLHILTARPSKEEEARIEHQLYGHVDGGDTYSVGRWLEDLEGLSKVLRENERPPVFVGGTGLYFKALTEGLSPIPPIDAAIRRKWRAFDPEKLHEALAAQDPEAASTLLPSDTQRLCRALEVFESTGQSILFWQSKAGKPLVSSANTLRVFLDPDRDSLYRRINTRFDEMMAKGALDEVETLRQRGLSPECPVMRAHGVPHLIAYLNQALDLESALERSKADVRHYAKRQKTWFRNQMDGWHAIDPQDEAALDSFLIQLT